MRKEQMLVAIRVQKTQENSEIRCKECLKVQASTSNSLAVEGLGLLLQACDEASAAGLGLFMLAD
jgi:hypothetical protein